MNKEQVTARDLAHLIGLLSSTIPAVNVAPLHYRAIQRLRHKALSVTGDYDRSTAITDETRKDLTWWIDRLQYSNGHSVVPPSYRRT